MAFWLALLLVAPAADPAGAIRADIFSRFVDPRTQMLRTRLQGDTLEDATLYGGFLLAALCEAWELTREPELPAQARLLFDGLVRNATVADPGFVARGVYSDGKYKGDPSVDQYTALLYALYRYHASPLSAPADKATIRRLYADVLTRLERDGYEIRNEDHTACTTYGHLDRLMPSRSERLLSFLLAGAHVTADPHWYDEYERLRPARMATLRGHEPYESWVLIQTAASLRMLLDLETRLEVHEAYRAAADEVAGLALPQTAGFEPWRDDPRPLTEKYAEGKDALRGVRIPIEAVTTALLVGNDEQRVAARSRLGALVAGYPVGMTAYAPPFVSLAWGVWLAGK